MKLHDVDFEYVEVGIKGPEGNPLIIEKKKALPVNVITSKIFIIKTLDFIQPFGLNGIAFYHT
jgi:hypothetical protein